MPTNSAASSPAPTIAIPTKLMADADEVRRWKTGLRLHVTRTAVAEATAGPSAAMLKAAAALLDSLDTACVAELGPEVLAELRTDSLQTGYDPTP